MLLLYLLTFVRLLLHSDGNLFAHLAALLVACVSDFSRVGGADLRKCDFKSPGHKLTSATGDSRSPFLFALRVQTVDFVNCKRIPCKDAPFVLLLFIHFL